MDAITVSTVVGEDRRLIIDLPADTPIGPVDVVIKPRVLSEAAVINPAREAARAKLLAAGKLVVDLGIPPGSQPLPDEKLKRLAQLLSGSRSVDDLIDTDRGTY
jgi:hypothetical protein